MDLQDILQLRAIQHIGNVEHLHCLWHCLGRDLEKESRDEQRLMGVRLGQRVEQAVPMGA